MNIRRLNGILSLLITAIAGLLWAREGLSDVWWLLLTLVGSYLALALLCWLLIILISLPVRMQGEYLTPGRFYGFVLDAGYRYICSVAGIRIHTSGLDRLPDQPFLLVTNHRSNFDNMIETIALGRQRPIAYISKKENLRIPVARRYLVRAGYLCVDRNDVRQSLDTFMKAAGRISADGCNVGVFPEGTRSHTLEMGEFHEGCFMIARRAKCPLVIATLRGSQKVHQRFPFRKTDVYFDILEVIPPEVVAKSRSQVLAAETRTRMQQQLDLEKEGAAS